MADIYKFPGGNEVYVCKKQDIIDCIDKNIIDKDIALTIIEQCEYDSAELLKQGEWVSIPFIGNIRVPEIKAKFKEENQIELLREAKEVLTEEKYILFRKELAKDNAIAIKQKRYFDYVVSKAISKNLKLYRKLCKEKGELFTKLYIYTCINVSYIQGDNLTNLVYD